MRTAAAPPPVERAHADDHGVRPIGRTPAAAIGILAVGVTFTVAELLARLLGWIGLVNPSASPSDSLGAAFIAITPAWLKDLGIGLFGQNDKVALGVAIVVVCAAAGIAVGLIGRISNRVGLWVAGVLIVVTGAAIITRPDSSVADLVPLALGGGAGLGLLHIAFRARYDETPGWGQDLVTGRGAANATSGVVRASRRRTLRLIGGGAITAAVAGFLAKLVPPPVDIGANRAAVVLPPVPTSSPGDQPTAPAAQGSPSRAAAPGAQQTNLVIPPALPYGANPDIPDLTPFVTPANTFYRVDTAFTLPRVATATWRLTVHGMVRTPFEITWPELLAMPQVERWLTLACVSNEVGGDLVGNAAWQGVRISDLLARAKPLPGADCVYSTSADDFTVTTPLDVLTDGRDALLAIGMNGAPLPLEHGFPARMVVPGLYGYVSATKWVVDLEVTTFAHATAYWTERGWSAQGPVKTSSRIDTPHYGVSQKPGVVPVAGVAWAQHRGISAVQVQVDDGTWVSATLSPAASADTWVQWVYRWDTSTVTPGNHRLTCRAIDGTGAVQIGTPSAVAPNGATGYHSISVVTS